ncbi:hypothetical protein MPH_06328 [Macrophomina phaseolina MS6]|uniref:Nephrocystin 3-like N-terminal domain-containing protein n=1 Tax=Macrophomina phaseolina (strain MS6) TaxID=1126212 RepID=K2RV45_MACPH|nr:hypothetical protein MPH_06328 [Macrophomina phaseolina MS6]
MFSKASSLLSTQSGRLGRSSKRFAEILPSFLATSKASVFSLMIWKMSMCTIHRLLHSINACMITLGEIKLIIQKCEPEPTATGPPVTACHARPGPWQNAKKKARWVIEKDQVERLLADLEEHKTMASMAVTKESMSSIIQILRKQDDATRTLNEIQKTQSEIRDDQIRNTERSLSAERRKILDDMSKLQQRVPLKKHRSLRTEGTGIAFLKSSEFANFDMNPNSRLWLYGIPGAGMSVLSTTIVEHFEMQCTAKVGSAYFFCEYADKATQFCRSILGSLVRQLALQSERAFEDLLDFYKSHTAERKSDYETRRRRSALAVEDFV